MSASSCVIKSGHCLSVIVQRVGDDRHSVCAVGVLTALLRGVLTDVINPLFGIRIITLCMVSGWLYAHCSVVFVHLCVSHSLVALVLRCLHVIISVLMVMGILCCLVLWSVSTSL